MPNWVAGPQAPTGAAPGELWFNTGLDQLNVFNGTIWKAVTPPGATLNASLHGGAGMMYIPMVNGSIGGSVNLGASLGGSGNGEAGIVYDVKNDRMWVWNGSAWKSAAFT